jgi:hypothetical protein
MLYEDLVQQYNRVKLEKIPKFENVVKELSQVKGRLENDIEERNLVI